MSYPIIQKQFLDKEKIPVLKSVLVAAQAVNTPAKCYTQYKLRPFCLFSQVDIIQLMGDDKAINHVNLFKFNKHNKEMLKVLLKIQRLLLGTFSTCTGLNESLKFFCQYPYPKGHLYTASRSHRKAPIINIK